eukprot:TRINITY_DN242_c0_g1_i2.p1 TRINITY_DN242_c0_g1~~TRINITY_DN242_c0_g1_i2.p1  ORF type:complete len:633 (+),score=142.70 TRINITY_DN242_c0_g1_i2:670-2568(+)
MGDSVSPSSSPSLVPPTTPTTPTTTTGPSSSSSPPPSPSPSVTSSSRRPSSRYFVSNSRRSRGGGYGRGGVGGGRGGGSGGGGGSSRRRRHARHRSHSTSSSLPSKSNKKTFKVAAVPHPSFLQYLWSELTSGYFEDDADDVLIAKEKDIANFLSVPMELERFLLFGFLICLDSFLFLLTFLPVRIVIGTATLTYRLYQGKRLRESEAFDLLRGILVFFGFFLLYYLDSSRLYHFIRGQAIIKLYVIFNILEIFDKLCCSIGQDILDSLFSTLSARKWQGKFLSITTQLVIGLLYVWIHEIFLFIKVITLNVAINSHENSVITLLISNQFVELKGSVFKNYKEQNIFQIACSDAVERFQMVTFLIIVACYNFKDTGWTFSPAVVSHVAWFSALVIFSEFAVDWTKHAFMTKFNKILPSVYGKFTTILASDISHAQAEKSSARLLDASNIVARRIGFVPIPLAALCLRVIVGILPSDGLLGAVIVVLLWLVMVVLKIVIRFWLLEKSFRRLQSRETISQASSLEKIFRFTRIADVIPKSPPPAVLPQKLTKSAEAEPHRSSVPITTSTPVVLPALPAESGSSSESERELSLHAPKSAPATPGGVVMVNLKDPEVASGISSSTSCETKQRLDFS